jgi:hypothetical protein
MRKKLNEIHARESFMKRLRGKLDEEEQEELLEFSIIYRGMEGTPRAM